MGYMSERLVEKRERDTMMLRAEVTRDQMKALRQIALAEDTTMQQRLGELIADHLVAKGYPATG